MKAIRWILRATATVVALAVLFVAGLLLVMWWQHRTLVTLPPPTGHFAVGRTTLTWVNEAQRDEIAPVPANREIAAWIWYPAAPGPTDSRAPYLPDAWRTATAVRLGTLMGSFFKHDASRVRVHSFVDAPVSPERRAYPVVLLRAGGSALTTDFTTLAEDLASHGYVVVGLDAAYRSWVFVRADGRVVDRAPGYNVENANGNLSDPVIGKLLAMWTSDATFVVNRLAQLNAATDGRFAGRLDLQRLGMFGHSFGGATALEFCHDDPRCKAAIDLDGIPFGRVVSEGLHQPAMFLLSDHSGETADPATARIQAQIQSTFDRMSERRVYAVIRTANHFTFSDQILLNSPAAMGLLHLGGLGSLDARRGLAIAADYVRTFFDVQLNHAPPSTLTALAVKYPEVQVQAR